MSTYSLGLNKHIILYSDFPQVRNSQIQIRKGIHDLLFVDGEEEVFDIPKSVYFPYFAGGGMIISTTDRQDRTSKSRAQKRSPKVYL